MEYVHSEYLLLAPYPHFRLTAVHVDHNNHIKTTPVPLSNQNQNQKHDHHQQPSNFTLSEASCAPRWESQCSPRSSSKASIGVGGSEYDGSHPFLPPSLGPSEPENPVVRTPPPHPLPPPYPFLHLLLLLLLPRLPPAAEHAKKTKLNLMPRVSMSGVPLHACIPCVLVLYLRVSVSIVVVGYARGAIKVKCRKTL